MEYETDPGNVTLQTGDIFFSRSTSCWGRLIRLVERLWAKDGKAEYNHTGIIINHLGATFEALNSGIKGHHIKHRAGRNVMIARPESRYRSTLPISDLTKHQEVTKLVVKYNNRHYPWYRMPLHLFPAALKFKWIGIPECSGLVARYLHAIGARHGQVGVNPDALADESQDWGNIEVIFKGVWQ